MPMTIPGAPDGGGALASYYESYAYEVGWIPNPFRPTSLDIQASLSGLDNKPATWVAFAAHSMQEVWSALPDNVRQEAQIALGNLIQLGLNNVKGLANNASAAAVSVVSDVVPLIGAIIEELIVAIQGFIKLAKEIETKREDTAAGHFMDSSRWTVEQYEHPDQWVMKRAKIANFLDRYNNKWRVRPSFGRSGGNSDFMFYGSSGPPRSGFCGSGVWMKCGAASYVNMSDCHKQDSDDPFCESRVPLSCLFYPFYSSAYPDYIAVAEMVRLTGGWGETGGNVTYTPATANSILMARQMALLTSPSVNLRVDADRLLEIRDRFVSYFFTFANMWAPGNAGKSVSAKGYKQRFGVSPIDAHHIVQRVPASERLIIDAEQKELPAGSAQNQFYFDSDGLIHAYHAVDLNAWGLPALRGPETPSDVAVSCAQYNTILSATLAFMSARVNFLRNGPMMWVLLQDPFDLKDFDSGVRSAMSYSAEVGKMLQAPSRAKPTPKRPIPPRPLVPMIIPKRLLPGDAARQLSERDRGFSQGEAAMLALAAGGLVAWKGPEVVQWARRTIKRRRRAR